MDDDTRAANLFEINFQVQWLLIKLLEGFCQHCMQYIVRNIEKVGSRLDRILG